MEAKLHFPGSCVQEDVPFGGSEYEGSEDTKMGSKWRGWQV